VKTNVLFFTKGSARDKHQEENCTETVWVYDLRINMPSFGKRNPFGEQHLEPFEKVYDGQGRANAVAGDDFAQILASRQEGEWSFNAERIETPDTDENQGVDDRLAHSRWRCFSRKWIAEHKGDSLDIAWLKDADSIDAANLPEPRVLASEAKEELTAALAELDELLTMLEGAN
jgi:type I restriction enzyme M protein